MKEPIYIKQTECVSESGDRLILCYFLTEDKENGKSYGIGVDMYTQRYDERTVRERKTIKGVFKTRKEAELFIEVLCSSNVTPSALSDIIDDRQAI